MIIKLKIILSYEIYDSMNGLSLCVAGDGKSGRSSNMIDIEMEGIKIDTKYYNLIDENLNMRYNEVINKWNELVESPLEQLMDYIENYDTSVYIYEEIKNFDPDMTIMNDIMTFTTEYEDINERYISYYIDMQFDNIIKEWAGIKFERIQDIINDEIERRMNDFFEKDRNRGIMEEITKFMNAVHEDSTCKAIYWNQFIITKIDSYMYNIMHPYISIDGSITKISIIASTKESIIEYLYMISSGLYALNQMGIPVSNI